MPCEISHALKLDGSGRTRSRTALPARRKREAETNTRGAASTTAARPPPSQGSKRGTRNPPASPLRGTRVSQARHGAPSLSRRTSVSSDVGLALSEVLAWGWNGRGQCGLGSKADCAVPEVRPPCTNVARDVSADVRVVLCAVAAVASG